MVPSHPVTDTAGTPSRVDDSAAGGERMAALDEALRRLAEDPEAIAPDELYDLRFAAAEEVEEAPPEAWPTPEPQPIPDDVGIPEVPADELTGQLLTDALAGRGSLLVRGFFSPDEVAALRAGLQDLARLAGAPDEADATAERSRPLDRIATDLNLQVSDSPALLEAVLAMLRANGAEAAMAEHLGGRPIVVADRMRLHRDMGALPWHQDAAFFRGEYGAVNTWVALTPTGDDSPGLEVVPRRPEAIIGCEPGVNPSLGYGTAITPEMIEEISGGAPTVIPRFEAGDALLFDDMTMHRTHVTAYMTTVREVLVAWFFSPARLPPMIYPTWWTKLVW